MAISIYKPMVNTMQIPKNRVVMGGLLISLFLILFLSAGMGAVSISLQEIVSILLDALGIEYAEHSAQQATVFWQIRLPRIVLGMAIGGALGISGASMQGLFRNPLVDPSLMGVSLSAALCAIVVIVFSSSFPPAITQVLGIYLLPVFAFCGSLLVTIMAYKVSQRQGKTDVSILILTGVGINALAGALIGLVIFYANDTQIRNFTFWNMGDLGVASWYKIGFSLIFIVAPSIFLLYFHKALDAMAMGENEAHHLGISVEKVKYGIIILSALCVGASVSLAGTIGFIGLVVPHILRTILGPGHRLLLPGSLVLGATLLLGADLLARSIVAPAEISIGIITAIIGTPVFMALLLQSKRKRLI